MRKVFYFACLLWLSGTCSLIYQSVWLREFRLIFGASTMASAAVLAIFMGGLGMGSILLGARADRFRRPIGGYAILEIGITTTAAASPFLLDLARTIFVAMGGGFSLGPLLGTLVRLVLSTLVLLIPSFLMGGTLPALARAVETSRDLSRSNVAYLYGANTLGAVAGVVLSNFYLFEHLGNRQTLWLACLLNGLVVIVARQLSRIYDAEKAGEVVTLAAAPSESIPRSRNRWFVAVIAAAVGFAFMFMELVWYRMLGPILGGTTFTFGIILAVALAGIGFGGLLYPLLTLRFRPSLTLLALTCALEALFVSIPLGLGDRMAELAWLLRAMETFGFGGQVGGWVMVCMCIVFPVALIAGIQFPLLVALLGHGYDGVGKDTGLIYLFNTAGAILGSLAGGFGLLPILSAVGAWRAVVVLLTFLAFFSILRERRWSCLPPLGVCAIALLLLLLPPPSALWRHSGIGAGRAGLLPPTVNERKSFQAAARSAVHWEQDGVESGVALIRLDGFAFVVNGKIDGNIYTDAGTQVMGGLLGALLLPRAEAFCVIGLGTGSTAGWLAALPSTQRVDVIELEPDIQRVAYDCALANKNVMSNSKAHVILGDGREWLLTTDRRYDLIFSEPSNPYRAGVASLFTREFYEAAKKRLNSGGIFAQWVQAYEVDSAAICSVYTTLLTVFPYVETWQTTSGDLILLGTAEPIRMDAAKIRAKIAAPVMREALISAWQTEDLEGVLARFVGGNELARRVSAGANARVNTDDHNSLEYSFGRSVGKQRDSRIAQLRALARDLRAHRPVLEREDVNWEAVEQIAAVCFTAPSAKDSAPAKKRQLIAQVEAGQYSEAVEGWMANPWTPKNLVESSYLALAFAGAGNGEANEMAAKVERYSPTEAAALRAITRMKQKNPIEALPEFLRAFRLFQSDPWPAAAIMKECIDQAVKLAQSDKDMAMQLHETLKVPFAVGRLWRESRLARLRIAASAGNEEVNPLALEVLREHEPYPTWDESFLAFRARCYQKLDPEKAAAAMEDLRAFQQYRDRSIESLLPKQAEIGAGAGKESVKEN